MTRCPSELELELHLLEPARSSLGPHLAACERCRARLDEMRRVGDEFRRDVFPATVDAVVTRSRRRPVSRLFLAGVPAALAAAAVAFFLVRPAPDYVGAKGGDLAVTVFVAGSSGAYAASDGEPVPSRAAIRFEVRTPRECRLWIVSVDGTGQVSRLFPATGASTTVANTSTLPGGALLDGRAGPERIFAVCSPAPMAYADVERAARDAAAGGDAAVRAARALAGLPRDAAQTTLLLEKTR